MRAPERAAAPVIRFIVDSLVLHSSHSHSFEEKITSTNPYARSSVTVSEEILEGEPSLRIVDTTPDTWDPASMVSHRERAKLQAPFQRSHVTPPGTPHDHVGSTNDRLKLWGYAQDYGPRVVWPPSESGATDQFDPEEVMPAIQQSIVILTEQTLIDPVFQEMCHFYLTFLNRVIFNYALYSERTVEWMLQRFKLSNSVKLGMLCTAVLFRSNYERSILTPSLCGYEKELYSLALHRLPLDLSDPSLSTTAKLTAITEIMNYEFYAGKLSGYYAHGTQAVPFVRAVVGSNNIDLMNLGGEQTFDVRCFAWCDIFDSLATSRPTHFTYECDLENLNKADLVTDDKGGMLGFQPRKGDGRGVELEKLIRGWEFALARARNPRMRVARVAVQEIWRHAAILYVHHAILGSAPSDPIVRNSVKSIVKLSSVIQPGGNPDCFLQPTYFIAGTFATFPKDRIALKGRILGSGNERYLRDLAVALEEIWEDSDKTGRLSSWSSKPQSFVL
ncbi:hypothetical protein OPQ81_001288 [Rhizoctonia solani]|nr:hypothetical protein OPQ81_001288 [Rhizoctonia solani]